MYVNDCVNISKRSEAANQPFLYRVEWNISLSLWVSLSYADFSLVRSSHQKYSVKNVFLEISQISQENTCARISLLIKLQASACNFIKKETLAQVFSCEFCVIFKSTFSTEQLWTTASDDLTKWEESAHMFMFTKDAS